MKSITRLATSLLALMILTACMTNIDGNRYQNLNPKFDVRTFFDGNIKAWGIVQDFSGSMVQQFTVDITGTKSAADQMTLDETFHYQMGDGVKHRVWILKTQQDGSVSGTAEDIKGIATGAYFGNAFQFQYQMDLPVDDTTYSVTFDDWMWAFDEQTLINRSYIKKFGFVVAEVTIFMQKQ